MVVKLDQVPHEAEDAEVSNCVSNLIQAFTNGLNIYKRLRDRRRKRKARKESRLSDTTTSPELQLSESLRKGPYDLAEKYAACYAGQGRSFARGDAIAHASLAETLIKLNTGLVSIISTFLSHQSGKNHLDLDYKSLTDLSDVSRKEALHSMTQLYRRLSQSQLRLYNIDLPTCQRCGDCMHVDCSEKSKSRRKEKRKHASSRQKINGPVVTRMPIKSSSQSQLVVMRPKNKRKSSSSSSNSSAVKLGSSPTCASPLASPLPKYVPVDPLEMQATTITKSPVGAWPESERLRVDSFDDPRPTTWLDTYTSAAVEYDHYPIPELPVFTPTPRKKATSSSQRNQASSPPPSVPPTVKRRLGKQTPSAAYTFASDSTRLGEIPQHNWTNPWDYEEAERLNTEATVNEYAREVASTEKPSRKKGLFGFLRRGSAAGVAA